jgi:cobalt-precorrin-5B (C1)-methyltransferase
MMVHSKSAPIDFGFLAKMAEEAGAQEELVNEVKGANTASQVGDMMWESGLHGFFDLLCGSCCEEALKQVNGGLEVDTTIYTLKGELLGKTVRQG